MKLDNPDPRLPPANPWGVGETPYVFAPGAQRGQSWELETDIWEVDNEHRLEFVVGLQTAGGYYPNSGLGMLIPSHHLVLFSSLFLVGLLIPLVGKCHHKASPSYSTSFPFFPATSYNLPGYLDCLGQASGTPSCAALRTYFNDDFTSDPLNGPRNIWVGHSRLELAADGTTLVDQ